MKKIIALALVIVALVLSFTSCSIKDAIKVNPYDLSNFPDSYEIAYKIVLVSKDGEKNVNVVTSGCDAKGNFAYLGTSPETLYLAKGEDSYDKYSSMLLSDTFKLEETDQNRTSAASTSFRYANYAYDEVKDGATYEKIDSLTLPEDLKGEDLIFLDAEKFEYYAVTGGRKEQGRTFQTAIEKKTGKCFYVHYDGGLNSSGAYCDEYYFYVETYTTPYNEDYSSKLQSRLPD